MARRFIIMKTRTPLRVNVKSLDEWQGEYTLNRGANVADLKKKLTDATTLPLSSVRLEYQDKHLKDNQRIEKVVKKDDKTIHLLAKVDQSQQGEGSTRNQRTSDPFTIDLNSMIGDLGMVLEGSTKHVSQTETGTFTTMVLSLAVDEQSKGDPEALSDPPTTEGIKTSEENNKDRAIQCKSKKPRNKKKSKGMATKGPNPTNGSRDKSAVLTSAPTVVRTTNPNVKINKGRPQPGSGLYIDESGIKASFKALDGQLKNVHVDHKLIPAINKRRNRATENPVNYPQLIANEHAVHELSDYIRSMNDSLHFSMPLFNSIVELLENEPGISDVQEREMATNLVRDFGAVIEGYRKGLEQLEFLKHFSFSDKPGEYCVEEPDREDESTQPDNIEASEANRDEVKVVDEAETVESCNLHHGNPHGTKALDHSDHLSDDINCLSIFHEVLPQAAFMAFLQGDTGVLDTHQQEIQSGFQSMLSKYSNDHTLIRGAFFDTVTSCLLMLMRSSNGCRLSLEVDYDAVAEAISDGYVESFKEVILRDYGGVGQDGACFSVEYIRLLKLYLGHMAFAIGGMLINGMDDLYYNLKAVFGSRMTELINAPNLESDMSFDALVWKPIQDGCLMYIDRRAKARKDDSVTLNPMKATQKERVSYYNGAFNMDNGSKSRWHS